MTFGILRANSHPFEKFKEFSKIKNLENGVIYYEHFKRNSGAIYEGDLLTKFVKLTSRDYFTNEMDSGILYIENKSILFGENIDSYIVFRKNIGLDEPKIMKENYSKHLVFSLKNY